jgi:hypothetical protein
VSRCQTLEKFTPRHIKLPSFKHFSQISVAHSPTPTLPTSDRNPTKHQTNSPDFTYKTFVSLFSGEAAHTAHTRKMAKKPDYPRSLAAFSQTAINWNVKLLMRRKIYKGSSFPFAKREVRGVGMSRLFSFVISSSRFVSGDLRMKLGQVWSSSLDGSPLGDCNLWQISGC